MTDSDFFRRVTRFVGSEDRDPAEDRLTQITAAVLERVPGLARSLALVWLDPVVAAASERATRTTQEAWQIVRGLPVDAAVTVRTQIRHPSRIVDLELRFHRDSSRLRSDTAAVVWVEVKHGTNPHSRQLFDYQALRPKYPGAVVLLSSRHDLPGRPEAECPAGVPQRAWQATARVAARAASTVASGDAVASWLLDEWLDYLRSEGLMALEALGPEHLTALMHGGEARAALPEICEAAMGYVESHFGKPGAQHPDKGEAEPPRYGLGYWASWGWAAEQPDHEDAWDGAWLDWGMFESRGGALGIPEGAVFVMVGLSKPHGGEFLGTDPGWREAIERGLPLTRGRAYFRRWKGPHERLQRVAYLHQVLRGDSLEEQGASLGEWLVETLVALREHGPPVRDQA